MNESAIFNAPVTPNTIRISTPPILCEKYSYIEDDTCMCSGNAVIQVYYCTDDCTIEQYWQPHPVCWASSWARPPSGARRVEERPRAKAEARALWSGEVWVVELGDRGDVDWKS